jgi:hypothetical protein
MFYRNYKEDGCVQIFKTNNDRKEYTADGRGFLQGIYVKLGKRV